jgi:N-acetylmuramic acid 6-phosphate etherase
MDLPSTEQRAGDLALDKLDPAQLADAFQRADHEAARAVAGAGQAIARTIELAAQALGGGGRLILGGAGTSGRLAVMEAAECRPTFSSDRVVGCMAGGAEAFLQAKEGAEDDRQAGADQADALGLCADDLALGISASGRTPWAWGLIERARQLGARTGMISCSPPVQPELLDVEIVLATGPELLTGSTRLKAGTATKCALNAITTGSMARVGKVLDDLMIDVQATNAKLRDRARRIVGQAAACSEERARGLLEASDWQVKTAIVMARRSLDVERARAALAAHGGHLRHALEAAQ